MPAQEVDLQSLSLKLIFDNFADCDYRLGNEVISDVMVIWVSQVINVPFGNNFYNYNNHPVLSEKATEQPMLWDVLRKWSKRYWAYFEQVKGEKVERFSQPVFNFKNPYPQDKTKLIRNEFLNTLATLDTETVIQLMAMLIVECARRLNAVPNNSGEMKDDVADILYYTDTQFQLAI
jgi:hypothetical protein